MLQPNRNRQKGKSKTEPPIYEWSTTEPKPQMNKQIKKLSSLQILGNIYSSQDHRLQYEKQIWRTRMRDKWSLLRNNGTKLLSKNSWTLVSSVLFWRGLITYMGVI